MPSGHGPVCAIFLVNVNKKFLRDFPMTLYENIKPDKCTSCADDRLWRTCVIDTEKTRLRSKNHVLAVKMLKIRKKCQVRAFFCSLSGKNAPKYLTYPKKWV